MSNTHPRKISSGDELFDQSEEKVPLQFREIDGKAVEGELRLRLDDVKKRVEDLENAQQVTQDLWELTISV